MEWKLLFVFNFEGNEFYLAELKEGGGETTNDFKPWDLLYKKI